MSTYNFNRRIGRKTNIAVGIGVVGFYLALIWLVLTFKLWLFGSLAVSSVKALTDNCGKSYPVEIYVINGDWFCSEEKK